MPYFKQLDALLKSAFEKGGGTPRELNPFYLSTADIARTLEARTEKQVGLDALERVARKLQLNARETMILLLLFAPELDAAYERIYAYLQDDLNRNYPTVQLLAALLAETPEAGQELYGYFLSDSKLLLLQLVEFGDAPASHSLFRRPLRVAPSLRNYLLGSFRLDGAVAACCRIFPPLPEKSDAAVLAAPIEAALAQEQRILLNLYGRSEGEKREQALAIASHFGFGLLVVHTPRAMRERPLEALLGSLCRDALLAGTLLYFEAFDAYTASPQREEPLLFENLGQLAWLSFFSTELPWRPHRLPAEQLFHALPCAPVGPASLEQAWRECIAAFDAGLAETEAPRLAALFRFSRDEIEDVRRLLHSRALLGKPVDRDALLRACRSRIGTDLGGYAQRLATSNTLDAIVLPEAQKVQLEEILLHYHQQNRVFGEWGLERFFQSRGIGVLFSGASGTGKTMAASILANTLGLELYRIELSQIVSKYIGETEKHLSAIFAAAESSGVILFFDEADALFGKRTEVKDAHDRYANIEVSYLLQKIEAYDGLVILATNFRENVDDAFVRRLRFIIDFPMPDERHREAIWRRVLADTLPHRGVDFSLLARRFKLSGANIRNAVLYAAFDAAGHDTPVTMKELLKGVQKECQKIGLACRPGDFEEG